MHPGAPAVAPSTPVRRPPSVTGAAAIMTVMGVVGLVHALAGLAMMNRVVERVRRAAADAGAPPPDVDTLVWTVRAGAIVAAVVGVVFALLLLALALGNLRGSNAARLTTWIVGAVGLLAGCAGTIATVIQRGVRLNIEGDQVRAELLRAVSDAYPSWWIWLTGALCAAQALGYLVVALLLALPPATAFFRREPSGGGPAQGPSTPPM